MVRGRQLSVSVGVLLLIMGIAQVPAPASAHCAEEGRNTLVGPISTCDHNDDLEAMVDELNAASDDTLVYVLVKDLGFHPPVVELANGGTVTFIYTDVEGRENHDPKSSGTQGANCLDAHVAPESCVPAHPGACFAIFPHTGGDLANLGDTYSLTFQVDGAGKVAVSNGILTGTAPIIGEEPFADRFRDCPDGTVFEHPLKPDAFVLPYHCGVHGGEQTAAKIMRGALVLKA